MQIINNGSFIKAIADKGYKIFIPSSNSYHDFVIVGKMEYLEKYKEVKDPDITDNFTQEKIFNDLIDIANDVINN